MEAEINIAEQKVKESKQAFDEITCTIKEEFDRFDLRKMIDFRSTTIQYLRELIEVQENVYFILTIDCFCVETVRFVFTEGSINSVSMAADGA